MNACAKNSNPVRTCTTLLLFSSLPAKEIKARPPTQIIKLERKRRTTPPGFPFRLLQKKKEYEGSSLLRSPFAIDCTVFVVSQQANKAIISSPLPPPPHFCKTKMRKERGGATARAVLVSFFFQCQIATLRSVPPLRYNYCTYILPKNKGGGVGKGGWISVLPFSPILSSVPTSTKRGQRLLSTPTCMGV